MDNKRLSRRRFIKDTGSIIAVTALSSPFTMLNTACKETPTESEGEQDNSPLFTDLFEVGSGDYPRYRITSLVVTKSGTVVAVVQGRQEGEGYPSGDNAHNDLVVRRSTDGGETWESMQVIAEDGDRALTPHCTLYDRVTDRIILNACSFPDGCHTKCIETGYFGEQVLRIYQIHSDDEGKTWSEMREVTEMIRRPEPFVGGRSGSGMGIQLRHKPYQGRLILPTNNRYKKGKSDVCAVYSDDHGGTWHWGDFASRENVDSGPNETQMVELADGTIMLNTRADSFRKIAYSYDGGETWTPLENEPQLIDSSCNASIIRYSDPLDDEKSRLLFSNPASQASRENGTVRLSYDEGESWPVNKTIYKGDFGYSSLARLPNGDVGMLFERDKIARGKWRALTFARFSMEWLTDGNDMGIKKI